MSQLDNIESKVEEIRHDVKELKDRVLTLEITDKVRQNQRVIKIQWVIITVGFVSITIALARLLL